MRAGRVILGSLAMSMTLVSAGVGQSGAQAASRISSGPLVSVRPGGNTTVGSGNWSGYATIRGPFTSVSASWVQPTVKCGSRTTYASFWVGLDGYRSTTVEQTGTLAACSGGHATYLAWVEFFPAPPHYFSTTVKPGDALQASVTESAGRYTTRLHDATQHWTVKAGKTLTSAKHSSAEVIAEAPSSGTTVLPLANFGTVRFTGARANSAAIGTRQPIKIVMLTGGGTIKASPSNLTSGKNFSITWHHI